MKLLNLLKHAMVGSALLLMSQGVFAVDVSSLTCPTPEQLLNYQSQVAIPYGYDAPHQSVKFIDHAAAPKTMIDGWHLIMYPVLAKPTDDVHDMATMLVKQLQSVYPTPFVFKPLNAKVLGVPSPDAPFCVYTLPNQEDMTAIAYYVEANEMKISSKSFAVK